MSNENSEFEDQHLTEQEFIDLISRSVHHPVLHRLNQHLLQCQDCEQHLAALILFSIKHRILETESVRMVNNFFNSLEYRQMKQALVDEILSEQKAEECAGASKNSIVKFCS